MSGVFLIRVVQCWSVISSCRFEKKKKKTACWATTYCNVAQKMSWLMFFANVNCYLFKTWFGFLCPTNIFSKSTRNCRTLCQILWVSYIKMSGVCCEGIFHMTYNHTKALHLSSTGRLALPGKVSQNTGASSISPPEIQWSAWRWSIWSPFFSIVCWLSRNKGLQIIGGNLGLWRWVRK